VESFDWNAANGTRIVRHLASPVKEAVYQIDLRVPYLSMRIL
jgi:hypothetical protein